MHKFIHFIHREATMPIKKIVPETKVPLSPIPPKPVAAKPVAAKPVAAKPVAVVKNGVRATTKELARPKRGEGVGSIITGLLLKNKSTNDDIVAAISKEHGEAEGARWRSRIAIFRCDINAGRRLVKQVAELGLQLPLTRFVRKSGKLVSVDSVKTEE